MNPQEYEARVVIILDAVAKEEQYDGIVPKSKWTLHLLLQDVASQKIFQSVLQEEDVRKIVRQNTILTSRQMIDLSILLRSREEPLKMMVPKESEEDLTAEDIIKSRNLDQPKTKRKNRNYRNKKKKFQNNNVQQSVK
jgi:hypothetical protein